MDLRTELTNAREQARVSQTELAARIGVAQQTVWRWETLRSGISRHLLAKVERELKRLRRTAANSPTSTENPATPAGAASVNVR